MRDRERLRALLDVASRATATVNVMRRVGPDRLNPLERMHHAEDHLRASRTDGVMANGSDIGDPTGDAVGGAQNRATADLRKLDYALNALVRNVTTIERVLAAWPEPRRATELDRLALERLNVRPDPGCESCARTEGSRGPRWVPVDPNRPNATDCGGRLAKPMLLCSWCRDKVDLWGRLPSTGEVDAHHSKGRVPWPKDVPRPS